MDGRKDGFSEGCGVQEPVQRRARRDRGYQHTYSTDVFIPVTSMAICGSDLYMSEGRTGIHQGTIFAHENQGIVEEAIPGSQSLGGLQQGRPEGWDVVSGGLERANREKS